MEIGHSKPNIFIKLDYIHIILALITPQSYQNYSRVHDGVPHGVYFMPACMQE